MSESVGCFVLVLHGHIPYVLGHGAWPHGSQMLYVVGRYFVPVYLITAQNARLTIARVLVATLFAMWRKGEPWAAQLRG